MSKQVINIRDGFSKNLKDDLSVSSPELKGSVEIFEKRENHLKKIREKHNLIVYNGREWLLRRAFGNSMLGNESDIYNKQLMWFGLGQGGGEPGNPLQAGSTNGSDTGLKSQIRLRSDLEVGDDAYGLYSSDMNGDHGYYKKFTSTVMKEDHANPYVEGEITKYPPLIAEIRIEISSDDANGVDGSSGWVDLNEAALFVSDPSFSDPGDESVIGGTPIGDACVRQVIKDGDYAIYILNSLDLSTDLPALNHGDFMYATRSDSSDNEIDEANPLLVVDVFNGETGKYAYVVVENQESINEDLIADDTMCDLSCYFINKEIQPYTMFSRTTFSSLRKQIDREFVFLWRIYF